MSWQRHMVSFSPHPSRRSTQCGLKPTLRADLLTLALGLIALLTCCSAEQPASQLKSDAGYISQLRRVQNPGPSGSRFLSIVRRLASSTDIYDPDAVGSALSLKFVELDSSTAPYQPGCPNSYAEKANSTRIFNPVNSWFKESPDGVPEMFVPAMFINPSYNQGKPHLSYSITRTEMCTGRMDPRNFYNSAIEFENLSGFACLKADELMHELHAQYQIATDGFSSYTVSGQSTDKFGSGVTFEFRAGAPCALSATVWQSDKAGFRYNRAYAKFRVCKKSALAQFCKANAHRGMDFFQALDDEYYEKCGGIGDFYDQEPQTGESSDGAKWIRGENSCPLSAK